MRVLLITDIHAGAYTKNTSDAISHRKMPGAEQILSEIISDLAPTMGTIDHVVILGDLINDTDRATDLEQVSRVVTSLDTVAPPKHYLIGNHDLRHLSLDEYTGITRCSAYYSFDMAGYHHICLYSDDRSKRDIIIDDEQLAWFRHDLAHTTRPTLIFVHHTLAEQDVTDNFWYKHKWSDQPHNRYAIKDRESIRSIISGSGKVLAVLNGHLHWNNITLHDDIPYITIQSTSENIDAFDQGSRSYAILDIDTHKLDLTVYGNDRLVFRKIF